MPHQPKLSQYLLYCDMTTSKNGVQVDADERIAEILTRYGTGHLVSRAITRSRITLELTVKQVAHELTRSKT